MGETFPQTIAVDGETYEYDAEKPYRDADLLETLYWERGMSQYDIAESVGCSPSTVGNWMDKLGVDVRTPCPERPPYFRTHRTGYERWETEVNKKKHHVRVHRLLAVAEYGFSAVTDMDVHHKNHIPWDNRSENIALKTSEQHSQDHQHKQYGHESAPWQEKEKLQELYVVKKLNTIEVAEKLGCNCGTIWYWLNKHDIQTRSNSEANKLRYVDDDQQTLAESAE